MGRWKGEVDSVRGGPQFGNPWQRREKVDTSRTEPNRTETERHRHGASHLFIHLHSGRSVVCVGGGLIA